MAARRGRHSPPGLPRGALARYAGRVQRRGRIAPAGGVRAGVQAGDFGLRQRFRLGMPGNAPGRHGVKEDGILDVAIGMAGEVLGVALDAGDAVAEILRPENAVQQQADIMLHFDINVDIDGAGGGHQGADGAQPFPQGIQVGVAAHPVGVGRPPGGADAVGAPVVNQKVVVGGKGRVDINQVHGNAHTRQAAQAVPVVARVEKMRRHRVSARPGVHNHPGVYDNPACARIARSRFAICASW